VSTSIKAINPHSNPRPFPLPSLRPDGPPAINGKPPAAPSLTRLTFHPRVFFLSSRTHPCASLCLCNALTHTLSTNFTAPPPLVPAAAVDPSPPVKARPPPVFFDLWDR
jgi:hypothetical protein